MTKPIHPKALFRLSVIGPLTSRETLVRGELKILIQELSNQRYNIPGGKRIHLSPQIIEKWYYAWKKGGIDALDPKTRRDKNKSQLAEPIKSALLTAKQENPTRSINTLISLLEDQGIVAKKELARATIHRFLQTHQLSKQTKADAATIERRAFVALYAGDIWQGDVLHGPTIPTAQGARKTYLVSLLDDASRLIAHSAFCLGETALDIEGVLKQGVLKRGIPKKLIIDNGAAYRSHSLQSICARLQIRLVYCPAYEPQGKGKLERYHRTFRSLFLNEIDMRAVQSLADLNARLWAWTEQVYHQRPHEGLNGKTPLARYREDLVHIRGLGSLAHIIDDLFCHRVTRLVRKDATVSWEGKLFEVPYEHSGKKVNLVVDPHAQKALRIESLSGDFLGLVTALDPIVNLNRLRQRPKLILPQTPGKRTFDAVETAYREYNQFFNLEPKPMEKK